MKPEEWKVHHCVNLFANAEIMWMVLLNLLRWSALLTFIQQIHGDYRLHNCIEWKMWNFVGADKKECRTERTTLEFWNYIAITHLTSSNQLPILASTSAIILTAIYSTLNRHNSNNNAMNGMYIVYVNHSYTS